MKPQTFFSLVLVVSIGIISVVGCSSFNRYTYTEGAVIVYQSYLPSLVSKIINPEETPKEVARNNPDCLFVMPAIPPAPVLPIDALSHVKPDDTVAIDQIQQRHIDELRKYISSLRANLLIAKKRYQTACPAATDPMP